MNDNRTPQNYDNQPQNYGMGNQSAPQNFDNQPQYYGIGNQSAPQYYNGQPTNQRPAYQPNQDKKQEKVMSVKEWVGSLILLCIPTVGLICLLIWAFGGGENKNRTNYARASLIVGLISTTIIIILYVTIFSVIIANLGNYNYPNTINLLSIIR
ncbi:MAG: hypothetical protein WCR54_00540 [Clostridia bacterium]